MISEAVVELLTNHEKYKLLSNNAMKAAKEKYNWKSEEKKYLKIFMHG